MSITNSIIVSLACELSIVDTRSIVDKSVDNLCVGVDNLSIVVLRLNGRHCVVLRSLIRFVGVSGI